MKLILHIFQKDARHLWKEIGVSLLLLAWLTHLDCWRSSYLPGSAVASLNYLLPLVWCYLAGLCVLQDPVPGERPFWLALPVGRGAMWGAKALFVAAFIHLPYLLSCAFVIHARGFSISASLPRLLEAQVLVLLALSVPALAVASLARNAMQFVLSAICLAGVVIVVTSSGQLGLLPILAQKAEHTKIGLVLALLSLFSVGVIWSQYRSRRTRYSRGAGIAGIFAACALYSWLSVDSSARLEAALHPVAKATPITIRAGEPDPGFSPAYMRGNGYTVVIPITVTGVSFPGPRPSLADLSFEIDGPGALRSRADGSAPGRQRGTPALLLERLIPLGLELYQLSLEIEPHIYSQVSRGPVTLRGSFVSPEVSVTGPYGLPNSGPGNLPGVGRCEVSVTAGNLYSEGGLRIFCESLDTLPQIMVTLTDTETGGKWQGIVGSLRTATPYPSAAWLSPMNRAETYFQLTSGNTTNLGNQWRVPLSTLQHYRLEATVRRMTGSRVVDYELPGIELSRYKAKTVP